MHGSESGFFRFSCFSNWHRASYLRSFSRCMFWFLLGLFIGAVSLWLLYLSARKNIVRLDEEKQLLQQEKQIVLEFMHSMVEAIGSGGDRQELFQRIVHAAILSTGALSACVFEYTDDDKLRGVAVEGLFPPQKPLPRKSTEKLSTRAKFIEGILRSEVFSMGETIIGAVARSGEAVLIEDATKDPRVVQHDDPSLKVRSMIVAPILFRKKVLGVLAVANPADGMAFNDADLSLVQSLAEQAGMALHNSDLMKVQIEKNKLDFDLTMASSIQGMLLPTTFPENPSLDIDAYYRPAQKIGGDLYDVFRLDDHRIGVAIADVSGKGVPASLLMAICQTNLRHFVLENTTPTEVLKSMNKALAGEIRQDMFITMIYAIFDTRENTLTLARAGHELPLVISRDANGEGNANYIHSEGMALGMVPPEIFDLVIEDKTIPFNRGDVAVFYTDGVTEAANTEGAEFGNQRFSETVLALRDRNAKDLNAGIVSGVERFTGHHPFPDDMTLITVKHV